MAVLNFVRKNQVFFVLYILITILWCWDSGLSGCIGAIFASTVQWGMIYACLKGYKYLKTEDERLKISYLLLSLAWLCGCNIAGNTFECLHHLYEPIPSLKGEWFIWVGLIPFTTMLAIVIIDSTIFAIKNRKN